MSIDLHTRPDRPVVVPSFGERRAEDLDRADHLLAAVATGPKTLGDAAWPLPGEPTWTMPAGHSGAESLRCRPAPHTGETIDMLRVDEGFAAELAEVGRLLSDDLDQESVLHRLVGMAVGLVPGCTQAGITMTQPQGHGTVVVTDARVERCHDIQFGQDDGPCVETLVHNEPRRVDDTEAEPRWRPFCAAAAGLGLRSCLTLPIRTDRRPAGALTLYAEQPHVFTGASHDVALLFAAQGSTTIANAELHRASRQLIDNLYVALESRAVIEQAKGILMERHSCPPEKAFEVLSRASQSSNTKLREVARRIVDDPRFVP